MDFHILVLKTRKVEDDSLQTFSISSMTLSSIRNKSITLCKSNV